MAHCVKGPQTKKFHARIHSSLCTCKKKLRLHVFPKRGFMYSIEKNLDGLVATFPDLLEVCIHFHASNGISPAFSHDTSGATVTKRMSSWATFSIAYVHCIIRRNYRTCFRRSAVTNGMSLQYTESTGYIQAIEIK